MMHITFDSSIEARKCQVGDVDLARCIKCGFAWNASFDDNLVHYDPSYNNCQTFSNVFRSHVIERAELVGRARPDQEKINIVEIGAGQGDFLRQIHSSSGVRVVSLAGFDPAFIGENGSVLDSITMFREYFSTKVLDRLKPFPDVIVSRHTIEHIKNPCNFIENIRSCIGTRDGVELFLETPDFDWIVENQAFEDVFYEHCSIFNAKSLEYALVSSGFTDVRVENCFGGQYLWASGIARTQAHGMKLDNAEKLAKKIDSRSFAQDWSSRLKVLAERGHRVIVWGAGAKGMTFVQLVDPDARFVSALIDINPGKQGRFIAGTGHVVLSPEDLLEDKPDCVIVTNPKYITEIERNLIDLSIDCDILVLR